MSSALILDIIILTVLVLFILLGAHRGFILTLCGLLALFVAFIGASFVSNTLCEPVGNALRPTIESHIQQALTDSIRRTEYVDASGGVAQTPEELPLNGVLDALKDSALYRGLAESFQDAVNRGITRITTSAAQSLADYAARELARSALFLLFFFLILIAWFLLSHALDLVAKLPVLNTVNRVGGGIIGAVKGLLILCVCAWILYSVTGLIPDEMAEGSLLLPFLLHPMDLVQRVQTLLA